MAPRIKFCGLTREQDAAHAVALGAAYLGVIFAGGPRQLTPERAREVLDAAGGAARRVGVFGDASLEAIEAAAVAVRLDVVQLHLERSPDEIVALRGRGIGEIWSVVRIADALPGTAPVAFAYADAVVLDKLSRDRLGGAGIAFDWAAVAEPLRAVRGETPVVLAGGLTPENVERAARTIAPSVVDVSSGVERAPGIKDHARMRAFAHAVGRLDGNDRQD